MAGHGSPGRVRRVGGPAVAVVMVAALALATAGCSSSKRHTASPTISIQHTPGLGAPSDGGSSSPLPSPTGTSDRDQVAAAYYGYWDASKRAGSATLDQARQILAPYSTPELIAKQIEALQPVQAKHQEPWGNVVIHIYSVQVSGASAKLGDCQDDSGAGLADSRTHQLIPGTRGGAQLNVAATLQHGSDGHWRVASVQTVGTSCSTSGN